MSTVIERHVGCVVTPRGRTLHVTLSDGQEFWLHTPEAGANLATSLLAVGDVHVVWSRGRESMQAELVAALELARSALRVATTPLSEDRALVLDAGKAIDAAIAKARGGR